MTQTSDRKPPRRSPAPGGHPGQDADGHIVDVAVCTEQGTRRVNADAVAERRAGPTGRTAVAIADGVGDTGEAGWAAMVAAESAARSGAEGNPVDAVLDAGRALASAGARRDCALAVAVGPRRDRPDAGWTLAWAGDCRVYAFDDKSWRMLTTDHTAAQELRAHGICPAAEWEHVLTVTVRNATAESVGRASLPAPRWLLLLTDGVHRALGDDRIHAALRSGRTAQDKAESLRRALADVDLRDNATAVVVACGTDPRSLRPRTAAAGRAV